MRLSWVKHPRKDKGGTMHGTLAATKLETIDERLQQCGISRRSFLVFCTSLMVAAPYGLALTDKASPEAVAAVLGKVVRPPVIWLHFQDCTGCTESMLQTSHPGFADLILNVISLEYHESWNPKIVKCEFCYEQRLKQDMEPACTAACPTGAVIFGKRVDLLANAKDRIAQSPEKYFEQRVYGEHEAGGTQVLYLASVSFQKLGLPRQKSPSKCSARSIPSTPAWRAPATRSTPPERRSPR